jgi:hypothetical protein
VHAEGDDTHYVQSNITTAERQTTILRQEAAIDYATCRACFRSGEIRILDSTGKVEWTIPFNEAERKM